MSDCLFGVSPVNYPYPDPDPDPDLESTLDKITVDMHFKMIVVIFWIHVQCTSFLNQLF